MVKDIIKNIPLTLDINARKRLDGTVDIRLYSKDIATGQFEFTLIDENENPVVLDETYSAQALVKYEGDSKTYLNDMIIEGNIIRFIFPHDFITKDGTITMYIYITKDSYTSDVAAISFPVFVSEIDKDLDPSISVHYIGKIEKLIQDMKDEIASYQIDVDEIIAGYEESISKLQALETDYEPQLTSLTSRLKQTVTHTELDAQLATLLDGGPSIFMNTLAELQTTYPNGSAGVALVRETDPAKIYVWDDGAWQDFGDYQGIELKDGAVTPQKTTFITSSEPGKNLFDKTKTTDGYMINTADGKTHTAQGGWWYSDPIPVEGGRTIVRNTQGGVYQYDSDDNKISGTGNGGGWDIPVVLLDNTKVIRLNGRIMEKDALQVEYGTVPTEYEPYKEVKKTLVEDIKITPASLEGVELLQAGEGIAIENNVISSTLDVSTPIANIDERLTNVENQTGGMSDKLYKVNRANNFTIFNKISANEYVGYNFTNNSAENYIRLWDLSVYKVSDAVIKISENYENPSVTMLGTQTDNHYTTTIGSTVSKVFTGHKIELSTFVRYDGGAWSVDIDGVDYGTVSTWNASSDSRTTVLADDLSNTDHTLTLTFIGDDPEHPATTSDGATPTTPRGWIRYHSGGMDTYPFHIYLIDYDNKSLEKVDELAVGGSNKDFAFHVRPMGQETPLEFFPYHSGNDTTTATIQTLSFDGIEIGIGEPTDLTPFKTGAFNQVLSCKLTTDTEERASGKISFVFDEPDRIMQFFEMEFKLDTIAYVGYTFMMPANAQYIDKVTTNVRESVASLDSDIGVSKFFENADIDGYRVTMKNGMEDYYIDSAVFNRSHPYDSFWLQNRDMTLRKVYPTVFKNTDLPAGTITYFDGYYKVGKMKNANLMV